MTVKLRAKVISARTANLLEDPEGELNVEDNTVSCDLGPFQIKTVRLRLGAL